MAASSDVCTATQAADRLADANALQSTRPGEAARRLLALLKRVPREQRLDVRFALANAFTSLGRHDRVESQLRAALKEARADGLPENRGATAYALAKLKIGKSPERSEVLSLLREAVRASPQHANANHWLGHQLLRAPHSEAEGDEATRALEAVQLRHLTDSHPLDTMLLRGQAHEKQGRLELAAESFRRAITASELDGDGMRATFGPRLALAHVSLARNLLQLGRLDDAVDAARRGAERFPGHASVGDVLGFALGRAGRMDEAVATFRDFDAQMQAATASSARRDAPERGRGESLAWLLELQRRPRTGAAAQPAAAAVASDGGAPERNGGWGWDAAVEARWGSARCNIERRSVGRAEFLREHAARNVPVILTGALDGWPRRRWERRALLERYGGRRFAVRRSGEIALDNEFGGAARELTSLEAFVNGTMLASPDRHETRPLRTPSSAPSDLLRHHLQAATDAERADRPYILGQPADGKGDFLRDDFTHPRHFSDARFAWNATRRDAASLPFIGPAGSGVGLHEHSNAWNGLVFGRKRWVLLPPFEHVGPTALPVTDWLQLWYPRQRDRAFECVQEAGELLYVPSGYMHAVLNLQPSVGVAVEVGRDTGLLARLLAI